MLSFNKWYNLFNILAVVEYIQRPIIYPCLNSPVTIVGSLEAIVAYVFLFFAHFGNYNPSNFIGRDPRIL